MSFNRDNVSRVVDEFGDKRARAVEISDARRAEIHQKIPEIAEIDRALSMTGIRIFEASRGGSDGIYERIRKLRDENQSLNKIRGEILVSFGYPEDYTDVKYECDLCADSGYTGLSMCTCMRRAIIELSFESSGIGRLMEKQTFDTFDLDFYSGQDREIMTGTLDKTRKFADTFGSNESSKKNILMIGHTGLGKTHLSTSIAKVVIENGYDVVYETSQNIFSDFEYQRFRSGYSDIEDKTERYFECDLLIMDDLGTESSNSFTVSCLYNIVNTRLNHAKSMIINTNLSKEELSKRYADRITSRLFGEFAIMSFKGSDIRGQKLKR